MSAAELARCGGTPVLTPQQVNAGIGSWPEVLPDDIDAVVEVLKSSHEPWGFMHPMVRGFQRTYGEFVERSHCLAVATGTAALHVAVAASGAEAGDEVITPALGFVASATCVLHHNCIPVFADVDPRTFNIDPEDVRRRITPRTRAIIAVDLLGLPAPFDELRAIADEHGLVLIEDAAQSQGATYRGRRAGALGDVSAMSIMASKNLPAAGEGGLLTTDDDQIWTRILGLASQGMNPWDETVGGPRRIAYQLGFNFRPTPTSFAFAWSQLTRLTRYQRASDARVAAFEQALGDAPLFAKPHVPEGSTHAWQMYRLLVDPEAIGLGPQHAPHVRDAVMFLVRGEGGMCGFWDEVPLPAMRVFTERMGYGRGCPWRCHKSHVEYHPESYPVTRRVIDSGFIVPITRATNDLDMVRRQEAYAKVAAHPEVVHDVACKIAEAGSFSAWCGVDIRDADGQRELTLPRP
ncbi:MAG: DegT/DnrJ/EryC1/StrS family aminotransferase [Deltaproteobacteria bacterium]|nr:DegT/DnrJ/EryC1/StrS family aminotransferase [Deltaproteobacteria bacterium]